MPLPVLCPVFPGGTGPATTLTRIEVAYESVFLNDNTANHSLYNFVNNVFLTVWLSLVYIDVHDLYTSAYSFCAALSLETLAALLCINFKCRLYLKKRVLIFYSYSYCLQMNFLFTRCLLS